eukprot:TRINITY_DN41446_c0_g1_i1.p1 TRINITY_DN41446_c0_g1~~TRINITY_DN41446_c0_g1_i1.p1  ORF type:complete len:123 (-),score=9.14 TRINITY_DN41446_c0_g1_i1:227-595(-)
MLRSLVGSEMCIRDRYVAWLRLVRRVGGVSVPPFLRHYPQLLPLTSLHCTLTTSSVFITSYLLLFLLFTAVCVFVCLFLSHTSSHLIIIAPNDNVCTNHISHHGHSANSRNCYSTQSSYSLL